MGQALGGLAHDLATPGADHHACGGGAKASGDADQGVELRGGQEGGEAKEGAHAAAALGAARLAAMACGGDEADWCQPLAADATFQPEPAQQALLAERYARFVALYPALQAQF